MPDQPNDHNQPPRPPRRDEGAASTRSPRKRDEDAAPRPPRRPRKRDEGAASTRPTHRSEDAPSRPPRRAGGGATRPTRPGAGKPARPNAGQPSHLGFRHKREARPTTRLANEGALYERYHMDPQWETIQEAAQRTLVLISRLLLERIATAGWQVVANHRTDAPDYLFGFDNTWTLSSPDGSRTVDFSPEQSYRDLLYLAASYQTNPDEPELDRQAINSFAALEQKATLIARRRVNDLTAESQG